MALDLAVSAKPGVYTLMGKEIDSNGHIVDPIRCDWIPGGVFVTPPGWWHSHHNESDTVAWVLPMQDAGLYTHQRTLDIRFVDDELALHRAGRIRGSAFAITNKQFSDMTKIGSQVPVPKVVGMKRVMSVESDMRVDSPEGSINGSNQAYHLLQQRPGSFTEGQPGFNAGSGFPQPGGGGYGTGFQQNSAVWASSYGASPPYPQYGAAFQLMQQDGSRRGSTQAYHLLKVGSQEKLFGTGTPAS